MKRTTKTMAVTATGALALGLGLGVAGLASADPTPSPSGSPSASASAPAGAPDGRGFGGGFGRHGFRDGGITSALAEKLGVDEDQVRSALRDYREANRPTTRPEPGTAPKPEDEAALAKALAEALDVDEAKVTTALAEIRAEREAARDQAVDERLAAAVKDGTLTQAEADAVRKAVDAGIVRIGRGR